MTRLINPVPQFLDGNGDPYANGLLYVYEAGTNTTKNTYADSEQTIANTNPVELDAAGRLPPVFYSGLARLVLKTSAGVQVWERDNVGEGGLFEQFDDWVSFVVYDVNDFVYRNGLLYRSLSAGNQGNDPATTAASWEEVRFLGTYNANITYAEGDVVRTTDGYIWRSNVSGNIANNPASDDGTNWNPAVNAASIAAITTAVPQSGGGALIAFRTNEIRDGGTYTLPAATSVKANQVITISLPERYRSFEPTVNANGADTITSSTGTDTSLQYNANSFGTITLTSDGAGNWSI